MNSAANHKTVAVIVVVVVIVIVIVMVAVLLFATWGLAFSNEFSISSYLIDLFLDGIYTLHAHVSSFLRNGNFRIEKLVCLSFSPL